MAAPTTTIVTGTIVKVNDNHQGFRTREQPETSFTLSRYAKPAPQIPPVGTQAELTIDGSGFVYAIEPVSSHSRELDAPQQVISARSSCSAVDIRLTCLSAAATFLTNRSEAASPDVLKVAAYFEQWCTRE